jgi:hypothetical protein
MQYDVGEGASPRVRQGWACVCEWAFHTYHRRFAELRCSEKEQGVVGARSRTQKREKGICILHGRGMAKQHDRLSFLCDARGQLWSGGYSVSRHPWPPPLPSPAPLGLGCGMTTPNLGPLPLLMQLLRERRKEKDGKKGVASAENS